MCLRVRMRSFVCHVRVVRSAEMRGAGKGNFRGEEEEIRTELLTPAIVLFATEPVHGWIDS